MQKIPRLSFIVDYILKQPKHIASVNVAVGELVAFTDDEIQKQWSALVLDTRFAKTKLIIHRVDAEQQCMVCFQKYKPLEKETACPYCGSVGAKILAGEEFHLKSFEEENE